MSSALGAVELAFLEAETLAGAPLDSDLKTFVRLLGKLRRYASSSEATPAQQCEAHAISERMAQRVLKDVRGRFDVLSSKRRPTAHLSAPPVNRASQKAGKCQTL